MAVSSLKPAQVAYVGETWFVGFDFAGWVPTTVTPVSNVITARDELGADVTGVVLSNPLVSGAKSVATFAGFSTGKTYTIIVATTMSNGEVPFGSLTITTETL